MDKGLIISLIVPVYNRPDEMRELLHSLSCQSDKHFELIVVEDGSAISSEDIVAEYSSLINVKYFTKPNSGPGLTRNYGSEYAQGEYLVYLDSDCVLPPQYVEVLNSYLSENKVDNFGGPDAASSDFSAYQKAVSYAMTSFFTTGGIRGGKRKVTKFYPRSFNMGYRRESYQKYGGFTHMRYGEDTELSYRLEKAGATTVLIPEAYVYHKRRTTLRSFMRQVFLFGMTRINLSIRYPKTFKLVHILPTLFLVYVLATVVVSSLFTPLALAPLGLLMVIWFFDSSIKEKSIKVGVLSIISSFIQLCGYGSGLLYGVWMRLILKKREEDTY